MKNLKTTTPSLLTEEISTNSPIDFPTSLHSTNYEETTVDNRNILKNKEDLSTIHLPPATIPILKPSYKRISKIQLSRDYDYPSMFLKFVTNMF